MYKRQDDKGPQINIQQPLERLFDRQKTQLQVNLKDDTAVASYEVRLLDDDGRNEVLAQATGLSEAEINVPSSGVKEIDIERYRPQTEPIALTLTVKATDLLGNESLQTRRILIQSDQPPKLAWRDASPSAQQQRGQPLRGSLQVTDDYDNGTVEHLLAFSSLRDLTTARQAKGLTVKKDNRNIPQLAFDYPEAGSWQGALLYNEKTFLSVTNGRLTLQGGEESNAPRSLKVGEQTSSWEVETYSRNLCQVRPATREVQAVDGLLDLQALTTNDTTRLALRPRSGAPAFIRELQFTLQESAAADVTSASGSRMPGRYAFSLLLQDGVGSAAQTAFLQLARSGSQSETDKSFATLMPLPVEAQGASVTLIGFATDRFSHERGEQPLNVLLQQPLSLDELAPRARLVSPCLLYTSPSPRD